MLCTGVHEAILIIGSLLTQEAFSAHLYYVICGCICLVYIALTVMLGYHYLVRVSGWVRFRGFQ